MLPDRKAVFRFVFRERAVQNKAKRIRWKRKCFILNTDLHKSKSILRGLESHFMTAKPEKQFSTVINNAWL